MFNSLRQSMGWVHTWLGLVLGFVLMICFFFGTLSVFDREIDRWAIPDTRFEPQPMPSFDKVLKPVYEKLQPDAADMKATERRVIGSLPAAETLELESLFAYTTHRDPVLLIGGDFAIPNQPVDPTDDHQHVHGRATMNPATGEMLNDDALKIGSDWFYPMHFSLHLNWMSLGYWVVGLAALVMLVGLVSGVIIHRKLFSELFTFRPWRNLFRSSLDLHNMTGVVALPFHFFFAFTALVIFASNVYLPVTHTTLKPLHEQHDKREAMRTGLPHEPAGMAAPLASVDAMVAEAKRRWAERDMAGEVGFLSIEHLGDENGYVSIYRAGSDRVALVGEGIHFKASTGEVLREDPPRRVVSSIDEFLTGLHLQHFEHWFLRWLYVFGGLLGATCIATGFVLFVEKRKTRHARNGSQGSRVVDAMAVTTVNGMLIAAIGMLVANRVLPTNLAGKGEWEQTAFWSLWGLALLHAVWRSSPVAKARRNPAWHEQLLLIGFLSLSAVVLNWITTGDHLIKTIFTDTYWAVAGVDLSLIATAVVAFCAAARLRTPVTEKTAKAANSNQRVNAYD